MNRTLLQAAGKCDLNLLIETLAGKWGEVTQEDIDDALFRAAGNGYMEITACLIARGADPDAEDGYGDTALIQACATSHIRIIRLLLDAGADVNIQGRLGRTALHNAINADCPPAALLILRSCTDCDPDLQDDKGDTAMISAAESGNALVVQLLLNANADVNIKNYQKYTALHGAVESGSHLAALILLEKNADPNVVDCRGNTPLLMACRLGHDSIASLLLEQGANWDVQDKQGKRPRDYAIAKFMAETLEQLMSAGAIDKKDADDVAPVLRAISSGKPEFLRVLIGANYNINKAGEIVIGEETIKCTPLEAAIRLGHLDMAGLLVIAGCDTSLLSRWSQNESEVPAIIKKSPKLMYWIKAMIRRPFTLKSLGRAALKKSLGFIPYEEIGKLKVSKHLQNFILFRKT